MCSLNKKYDAVASKNDKRILQNLVNSNELYKLANSSKIAPKVLMPRENSASCIVAVMQTEAKHV